MWTCEKCGERIEDQFDSCWRCSAARGSIPGQAPAAAPAQPAEQKWHLAYRIFRGTLATWEELFNDAAKFATRLGPERVLNISHSSDHHDGVVTVWYWAAEGEPKPD